MAVGDVVSALSSVSQASFLTIQPGAGVEWIIHNIYTEKQVRVHFYDGSNALVFDWINDLGRWPWSIFHLNNSRYLRIEALMPGTTLIGYDGVITK